MMQPPTTGHLLQMAIQYQRAGKLADAERAYRQVLLRQPGQPDALNLLGTVLAQTGRLDLAADLLSQAATAQPKRADIQGNLGTVLAMANRIDEARQAFGRALALEPGQPDSLLSLAGLEIAAERFPEAEALLKRAVAAHPEVLAAHLRLGEVLFMQRRRDEAAAVYRRAAALAPKAIEPRLGLAEVLLDQGGEAEAAALLDGVIAQAPNMGKAHYLKSVALNLLGRAALSDEALAKARGLVLAPAERRDFMPYEVYIQVSKRCNLRCVMCGHESWTSNTGFMDFALFEHILAECKANKIRRLQILASQGEPFLHPRIFDFLERAVAEGFELGIVTNGTPLTPERIERLSRIALADIQFSFCGYDKESYERIYVGAKFERVSENLRLLSDALKAVKSKTQLSVKGVAVGGDADFIQKTRDFLHSLGIDRLAVILPNNFGGAVPLGGYISDSGVQSCKNVAKHRLLMCRVLLRQIGIYYDGTVTACGCYDSNGDLTIGDIRNQSIGAIRKGESFRAILDAFKAGDVGGIPLCGKCDDPFG